jgi:hypothetical protein
LGGLPHNEPNSTEGTPKKECEWVVRELSEWVKRELILLQCLVRYSHRVAGTPNRMHKLADDGSLKLGRLQLIVFDVALDAKQRYITYLARKNTAYIH